MRRFVTILTAVVAVAAFSTMAFAQATTRGQARHRHQARRRGQARRGDDPGPGGQAGPAKPAKLSVKGEAKFDEATKELTVGDKTFTLAADAKIMMGAKTVTTADADGQARHGDLHRRRREERRVEGDRLPPRSPRRRPAAPKK